MAGEPYSAVVKRFGISDDALRYHMANHVDPDGVPGASTGAKLDEWRAFAGELYDALEPWPKARQAAVDRLRKWAAKGGKK